MNRRTIGFILGPALFFGVMILPIFPNLTPPARATLSSALLIATWWITESIPIAVTSLLPLVLFPVLGVLPSKVVAPNYTNHLVFLFLGGFLIAAGMEASGLHRRIALFIIRWIGGSVPRLFLGFMLATALLSMWVSNTATTMMMLPIALAVVGHMRTTLSESQHASFGRALMLAVAYSASVGGIGTLIGTPPNIVFSGLAKTLVPTHPEITFTHWLRFGIPVVVVLLPLIWAYLLRFGGGESLFGLKLSKEVKGLLRSEYESLGKMGSREAWVFVLFILAALLWITRSPIKMGFATIPGWSQLFAHSAYLHDATVAIGIAILFFIIRVDGEPLLRWKEAEAKIPWGVLLLFGGGFALANAFQSSGLATWFGSYLTDLGKIPLFPLLFITALMMALLTEVTSNTAITATMLPVLAAVGVSSGIDPMLLMIPATVAASCAFLLPVATPPNAIVFASGLISIRDMAKVGIVLEVLSALVVSLLMLVLL